MWTCLPGEPRGIRRSTPSSECRRLWRPRGTGCLSSWVPGVGRDPPTPGLGQTPPTPELEQTPEYQQRTPTPGTTPTPVCKETFIADQKVL